MFSVIEKKKRRNIRRQNNNGDAFNKNNLNFKTRRVGINTVDDKCHHFFLNF
jgi:hypothetical protein